MSASKRTFLSDRPRSCEDRFIDTGLPVPFCAVKVCVKMDQNFIYVDAATSEYLEC